MYGIALDAKQGAAPDEVTAVERVATSYGATKGWVSRTPAICSAGPVMRLVRLGVVDAQALYELTVAVKRDAMGRQNALWLIDTWERYGQARCDVPHNVTAVNKEIEDQKNFKKALEGQGDAANADASAPPMPPKLGGLSHFDTAATDINVTLREDGGAAMEMYFDDASPFTLPLAEERVASLHAAIAN